MSIVTGAITKVASRALDRTIPAAKLDDSMPSPLERARERRARALAMAETIDAIERYGTAVAVLGGAAAGLKR